jgi:hypothetical protein
VNIEAVAAGSVLLVAMLGVSAYAAVTLPPGAQVPVRFGPGGYGSWRPKRTALALWSGSAVVIYAVDLAAAAEASSAKGFTPVLILPVVLLVLIVNQMGAIRAARHKGGMLRS